MIQSPRQFDITKDGIETLRLDKNKRGYKTTYVFETCNGYLGAP